MRHILYSKYENGSIYMGLCVPNWGDLVPSNNNTADFRAVSTAAG